MLRKLKLSDAAEIQNINASALGYTVPLEAAQQKMEKLISDDEHHFILVYEDEMTGKVAGYVHGEVYDNLYSETIFNVMGLAVAKELRRKGIGKQLMTGLEKEALKRGYPMIRLNSGSERKNAHEFYQNLGYQADKVQKRFLKKLI